MKTLLIGSTGLIGTILQQQRQFDYAVHRLNIGSIVDQQFDFVVCAAPSSNRLLAQQNPMSDLNNIELLCQILSRTQIGRLVLISSCDTQVKPESVYGANRFVLENFIRNNFKQHTIIRLPALIHRNIKKNVLYDLKHQIFLDKINLHVYNQWYPLVDLSRCIDDAVRQNITEINLCSEPIGNWEIVNKFAPELASIITLNQIDKSYDLKPYSYNREQIFQFMKEYFE